MLARELIQAEHQVAWACSFILRTEFKWAFSEPSSRLGSLTARSFAALCVVLYLQIHLWKAWSLHIHCTKSGLTTLLPNNMHNQRLLPSQGMGSGKKRRGGSQEGFVAFFFIHPTYSQHWWGLRIPAWKQLHGKLNPRTSWTRTKINAWSLATRNWNFSLDHQRSGGTFARNTNTALHSVQWAKANPSWHKKKV